MPKGLIDFGQLRIQLVKELRRGVAGGVAGAASEAAAIAKALGAQIGNRADVAKVHSDIAESMREAMLGAYESNVEARKLLHDYGPRQNSPSRLSGVLRQVLEDPAMVIGDARGIQLGDSNLLQKQAKHAFRLNFGTRGSGNDAGPAARIYPISLFGTELFGVGLLDEPRPAIVMPPGLWLGGDGRSGGGRPAWYGPDSARRGTDIFFPLGARGREMRARNVEARRFLDAGLEALSEELTPAYAALVESWLTRDTRAGHIVVEVLGGVPSNLS